MASARRGSLASSVQLDDCIKNIQQKLELTNVPINNDALVLQLCKNNPRRTYELNELEAYVGERGTLEKLTPENHINKGEVLGVLKGEMITKRSITDVEKLHWPVMRLSYKGQPKEHVLPAGISESMLSLSVKPTRATRGNAPMSNTQILALIWSHENNLLRKASFVSHPSLKHNAIAKFVEWNNEIFLCVVAIKTIYKQDEIVIQSNDFFYHETYEKWQKRTNRSKALEKENKSPTKKNQNGTTKSQTPTHTATPNTSTPAQPFTQSPSSAGRRTPTSPASGGGQSPKKKVLEPFEAGKKVQMKHVGLIFHYPNQLTDAVKNSQLKKLDKKAENMVEQESNRRDPSNKPERTNAYVEGWTDMFRTMFRCDEVEDYLGASYEKVKKTILAVQERYKHHINDDTGVLMCMVFSPQIMDSLNMTLNSSDVKTHVFDLILNPLFEVKDDSPQRYFPIAIFDTSSGFEIYIQLLNEKTKKFEYIRWAPSAPNIPVLDSAITAALIHLTEAFAAHFSDSNVKKGNVLRIMKNALGDQHTDYHGSYYFYEKQKPSIEYSTTGGIIVDNPGDTDAPLPKELIKGKFVVILHITENDNKKSIDVIQHDYVALMKYLNVVQGCKPLVFSDFDDKEIQLSLNKEREKQNNKVNSLRTNLLRKLNEIDGANITDEDLDEAIKLISGLKPITLADLKWDSKYKITKERVTLSYNTIEQVAKECVAEDLKNLVVLFFAHGRHSQVRIGEIPHSDKSVNLADYYVNYADIYHKVREIGIENLIVLSGHCQGESEGELKNEYKYKYPIVLKGLSPDIEKIPVDEVRVECSVPQVGAIWTTAPDTQLPLGASATEFSPSLRQLRVVRSMWPKGDPVNPDKIVQRWNIVANEDLIDLSKVCVDAKSPIRKQPGAFTKLQIRYLSSFVFDYEWQMRN